MPWWNWEAIQRNGWKVIKRLVENRQTRVFATFEQGQPTKFVEQTSDGSCMTIIFFLTKQAARRWTRPSCWIYLAVYGSHAAAAYSKWGQTKDRLARFLASWEQQYVLRLTKLRVLVALRQILEMCSCHLRSDDTVMPEEVIRFLCAKIISERCE